MPHVFGRKKRGGNAQFAYLKRFQVGKTIAMRMGGGRFQIQPFNSLYDVHVETLDGVTLLVKVKSMRRKSKIRPCWRGIDMFMIDTAIKEFKKEHPGFPVRGMAVTTWGDDFRCTVIE